MTAGHMVIERRIGGQLGIEVYSGPVGRSDWYPVVFAPSVAAAWEWLGREGQAVAEQIRTRLAFMALTERSGE